MSARTGIPLARDPQARREQLRGQTHRYTPTDLSVATLYHCNGQASLGTDLIVAPIDASDRPVKTSTAVVAGHVPGSAGDLSVGVYRVDPGELSPGGFIARLSASGVSGALSGGGSAERVVVTLDRELTISRGVALWLFAVLGADAAVHVTQASEAVLDGPAWIATAPGSLPSVLYFGTPAAPVPLGAVEISLHTHAPCGRLLSLVGQRMLG